jgi:hypothetical protein
MKFATDGITIRNLWPDALVPIEMPDFEMVLPARNGRDAVETTPWN